MAQRRKRTRRTQDEFDMPLADAVALLVPNHNAAAGDDWTFFVRDGVLEMVVTRAAEDITAPSNGPNTRRSTEPPK